MLSFIFILVAVANVAFGSQSGTRFQHALREYLSYETGSAQISGVKQLIYQKESQEAPASSKLLKTAKEESARDQVQKKHNREIERSSDLGVLRIIGMIGTAILIIVLMLLLFFMK